MKGWVVSYSTWPPVSERALSENQCPGVESYCTASACLARGREQQGRGWVLAGRSWEDEPARWGCMVWRVRCGLLVVGRQSVDDDLLLLVVRKGLRWWWLNGWWIGSGRMCRMDEAWESKYIVSECQCEGKESVLHIFFFNGAKKHRSFLASWLYKYVWLRLVFLICR